MIIAERIRDWLENTVPGRDTREGRCGDWYRIIRAIPLDWQERLSMQSTINNCPIELHLVYEFVFELMDEISEVPEGEILFGDTFVLDNFLYYIDHYIDNHKYESVYPEIDDGEGMFSKFVTDPRITDIIKKGNKNGSYPVCKKILSNLFGWYDDEPEIIRDYRILTPGMARVAGNIVERMQSPWNELSVNDSLYKNAIIYLEIYEELYEDDE